MHPVALWRGAVQRLQFDALSAWPLLNNARCGRCASIQVVASEFSHASPRLALTSNRSRTLEGAESMQQRQVRIGVLPVFRESDSRFDVAMPECGQHGRAAHDNSRTAWSSAPRWSAR
jgi:hypothetical protein